MTNHTKKTIKNKKHKKTTQKQHKKQHKTIKYTKNNT